MSHLTSRFVKGKEYFYLEESFKAKGKWRKESVYLGPKKPSNEELLRAFISLKEKCGEKNHAVLVPPLTEFISSSRALKLRKAAEQRRAFTGKMSKEHRDKFIRRERITFISDSNAIEGSSLNYSETEKVLAFEKEIEKAKRKNIAITGFSREEQEALNLKSCLDRYDKHLKAGSRLSEKMILQLHYLLLEEIFGYEKYRGIYRPVKVYIVGSSHEFPLPQRVPGLVKELVEWLEENEKLVHPVELAAKFHTKFTSIHPFADGNGRMARLLMNYVLQQKGLPFTNIPLKRRNAYMQTQAAGNTQNYKPFTRFLAEEFLKQHLKKKTEMSPRNH